MFPPTREVHPWPEELREEYQVTAALRAGTATPELLADVQRNVSRLRDFKSWLNSRAIRAQFTSAEDLSAKVAQALYNWHKRHAATAEDPQQPPKSGAGRRTKTTAAKPTVPPDYLAWLQGQCDAEVELLGLQVKEGRAIHLNHVYVPLTTTAAEQPKDDTRPDAELSRMQREKPTLVRR